MPKAVAGLLAGPPEQLLGNAKIELHGLRKELGVGSERLWVADGQEASARVETHCRGPRGYRKDDLVRSQGGRPGDRAIQQIASDAEPAKARVDPHLEEMSSKRIRIVELTPCQADLSSLDLRYERGVEAGAGSRCDLTSPVGIAARSCLRESCREGVR